MRAAGWLLARAYCPRPRARTRNKFTRGSLQLDVLRGGAYQNPVRAARDIPCACFSVIVSQRAAIEGDRDFFRFARPKKNLLEALEFLERSLHGRIDRGDVELRDLRSGAFSGILHTETDSNKVIVLPQDDRIDIEIRVTEFRIRQSIPERILRL